MISRVFASGRVALLVAATAICGAMLCGTAAAASAPAARAADSSDPTLTLTPAMGPPGTHVAISGHLTASQIPVWVPMIKSGFVALLGDISATCNPGFRCLTGPVNLDGCELVGVTTHETIHADASTGVVTGSFVVGSTGICVQSDPDSAPHSAPPGEYELSVGCNACEIGTFTLTKAATTLPATGFPIAGASLCASGLLVVGFLLCRRNRTPGRRPRNVESGE